ncbi:MAG: AAA family ATPase [Clostridia bacterium]|nr:AAA family ATPase [Clostridia bacterium]
MLYLESFTLPVDLEEDLLRRKAAQNGGPLGYIDNPYPCGLFARKDLREVWFRRITIFYGGNGSGKSTLLNLIARKLELNRIAPHNSSEMFDDYAANCRYTLGEDDEGFPLRIPNGSRIITSDDVFDYMLALRTNNADIAENKLEARGDWAALKYGRTVKLRGMEDYEDLRAQVLARRKSVSRREYIRRTAGEEVIPASNGETALRYFEDKLKMDTLYCLDEPENSLSPKLQLQLVELLDEMARCCGCQFIIATHSPFLLALPGARIYDLDACPAVPREWWQLENTRIYFDFFNKHRHLFEDQPE